MQFCFISTVGFCQRSSKGAIRTKSTILVVDDEKEIADLVALYLENEGFSVLRCYNARDALAYMETAQIDLAILDVMLPETDGFALCRKIRETHTYPIIMLTSRIASGDKINGLSLGADDYVTKPFEPVELVARVKAQLRRVQKYSTQAPESESTIRLPNSTPGWRRTVTSTDSFFAIQPTKRRSPVSQVKSGISAM